MFENSGKKIKGISVAVFWITVISSIILAFVFGWQEEYHPSSYYSGGRTVTVFEPLYFFTFGVGVPVASYVSTLFLVAFGELVQNAQRIRELNEEIAKVKEDKTNSISTTTISEPVFKTKEDKTDSVSSTTINKPVYKDNSVSHTQQTRDTSEWKCQCGRTNAYYVCTCACGRDRPDSQ